MPTSDPTDAQIDAHVEASELWEDLIDDECEAEDDDCEEGEI